MNGYTIPDIESFQMNGKTIHRAPSLVKPIIVREMYRRGGTVTILVGNQEGPDRDIYEIVAAELGVTEEEIRDRVEGNHQNAMKNKWGYTMQVAVQKLKDGGFITRSSPKGVWELTPKGMELGKNLTR